MGIDGSGYLADEFDAFVAAWGKAIAGVQQRFGTAPDSPGVMRSAVALVAAVLRTVFGGAAGLVQGVVVGL